jgi:hypothetical protein
MYQEVKDILVTANTKVPKRMSSFLTLLLAGALKI